MLKRVYILPVLVVGLLSTSSWSIASPTAESSTPQIKPSSNERIQNLQMEEQEIKALYQKIEAETKLQEVQLKRKGIEKMAKAWEEAEEAKAANQKSQYEKLQADRKSVV